MQEHVAAVDPGREQRAVAAALASAGAGHPLLVEGAAQVRVDQTAFHLLDRLAQHDIGQLLTRLPACKVLALEDVRHFDFKLYPERVWFSSSRCCIWMEGVGRLYGRLDDLDLCRDDSLERPEFQGQTGAAQWKTGSGVRKHRHHHELGGTGMDEQAHQRRKPPGWCLTEKALRASGRMGRRTSSGAGRGSWAERAKKIQPGGWTIVPAADAAPGPARKAGKGGREGWT